MVSDTAIDALDELVAAGLSPTPRDVVRLNAIGLKLEAAQGKSPLDSTYLLPRVAKISPDIVFRQPAIGHELWLEQVTRLAESDDYQTVLALNAFALSRPVEDLPNPLSPSAVARAVEAFTATCAAFTRDQIFAAVRFCLYGSDPSVGEKSAKPASEPDDPDSPDWTECVAVGVLNEGRACLWGISEADMRRMTTRELSEVIARARLYHNMSEDSGADFWSGRFYATFDEIANRLRKEKADGQPTA